MIEGAAEGVDVQVGASSSNANFGSVGAVIAGLVAYEEGLEDTA